MSVCRILAVCGLVVLAGQAWDRDARAQTQQPPIVLTVHWGAEDAPGTPGIDAAIKETLLSDPTSPVAYFTEYLETDRLPVAEASSALSNYIREKYAGRPIDVVIAVSDPAFDFVRQHRADLFPSVPIVAASTSLLDSGVRTGDVGATGVIGNVGYSSTLALALQLQPSTKRVFVIAHAPTFDLVERIRPELLPFANRVELTYFDEPSLDRLLAEVRALPRDSVILYARHSRDEEGNPLSPADVARLVSEASRVPVYGVSNTYMGSGIVGGMLASREQIGRRLAEMTRMILRGTPANDIAVEPIPLVATLDWRALTRWSIDPTVVTDAADIQFRQLTVWERYRRYIVAAVALIAVQTLFIGALLVQRRRLQRAEAALRESEAHFRVMADTAPVMIWRSGIDKKCDFFNQPWLAYTGRTLEQELGDGWAEGVHADDLPFCLQTYTTAFEARQPFRMEYRLRRFDGDYRVVLDSGVPRWEEDGSFAGYIGSCIDISDRKQAERALQETHAELSRVSRLTALGEFAASIAHEVRQPLTAIIINARICLRWLGSPNPDFEEVKAGLLDVVTAGQRAEEVIKRNRELFRHHRVEAAAVNINSVIGDVAALVVARLRDNQITLATSLDEGLPPVTGDRIELEQVLLNLIANSIDAMERVPPESRRIDISSSCSGDQFVQVSVSDQGKGLAGVDVERMFTLSYTTKDAGTGVGLSVSRSIIEAHGGKLWAEQNEGRGATFYFTVPVLSSVAAA
jgi:PAS domain S-box-containing protein